jgi:hypothetical protein
MAIGYSDQMVNKGGGYMMKHVWETQYSYLIPGFVGRGKAEPKYAQIQMTALSIGY